MFLPGLLKAQQLSPEYRVYSVKDGLPSIETYDVKQDSKGYLWICTDAGVCRFDGYTFRNYTSINGLPDNTVFGISEDRKGRLWLRSHSGRLAYIKNDTVVQLPCNDEIQKILGYRVISSLYVDKGDTLWIGIMGNDLLKISPGYTKVTRIKGNNSKGHYYARFIDDTVICGAIIGEEEEKEDEENFEHETLEIMDGARTRKFASFNYSFIGMNYGLNMRCLKLSNGELLLTLGDGIIQVNKAGEVTLRTVHKKINCLYEDHEHNLWIGFHNNGADVYPQCDLSKPPVSYFRDKSITGIYQDRENSYWLSTLEEGVLFVPDLNFRNWKFSDTPNRKVSAIAALNNKLWIGFSDSSIIALDEQRQTMQKLFGLGVVMMLLPHDDGSLIVGGSEGTVVFRKNKKIMYHDLHAKSIVERKEGGLCAIVYNSVKLFDKNMQMKLWRMPSRLDALYRDSLGEIWVGNTEGYWRVDTSKGPVLMSGSNKLLQNRIMDIKKTGNRTWLASKGIGVLIVTPDTVINITTAQGLSSNITRSICFDITGAAWIATNSGISRIVLHNDNSVEVRTINSSNGLIADDVRQVISNGNYVYAGTSSGVTFFDVLKLSRNITPPPVYLTSVEVNGKVREPGSITFLKYDENYITFYFSGISFKAPGKIKYIYQLEGIDDEPRSTYSTYVQYTTLPPGTYTFRVFAENNDGIISSDPVTVTFTIRQPFWAAWWFITFLTLLIAFAMITIVMVRERTIRKRAMEKTVLDKKMNDLELKAIRAQMNPHFIFNALNSIQRFVLDNDALAAQKYLAKFARLIRNVLSNSTHQDVTLKKEIETLRLYVEIEALRFSGHFDYVFEVDESIDEDNLRVPSMFIQPYIENAIWHGLMHKEGDSILKIQFKTGKEHLVCIVEDNGIGRARSQELRKQHRREHESLGLTLNQERIAVLNQLYEGETRLIITDLYDDNRNPLGTRVEIEFPLVFAH